LNAGKEEEGEEEALRSSDFVVTAPRAGGA
jgi:hypothetical protein